MAQHETVSRDAWIDARRALLAEEKELTRQRDKLSAKRRALPWVRVDKDYMFEGPDGKKTLGELFGGKSQLIVYHFMYGPGWSEGCKACSFLCDHIDGAIAHLEQRDAALVAVSRAPWAEFLPFKERMGWQFDWVSSHGSDFNRDFHVSFDKEELESGAVYYNYREGPFPVEEAPGISVFAKNGKGEVFHTYSAYARGLDGLIGTYAFLDLLPKGRDEEDLDFTMEWVRHHDAYEH